MSLKLTLFWVEIDVGRIDRIKSIQSYRYFSYWEKLIGRTLDFIQSYRYFSYWEKLIGRTLDFIPYTHDYEISNIPTKYQVQHIGYYVGSFFSYHHLAEKDVYHNTRYKIMDQTALDRRYGEDGKRKKIFVLRATK